METNKKALRQEMTSLRNQLSPEVVQIKSQKIFDRICEDKLYKNVDCIFSYVSFRNEVDTKAFHRRVLKDHKILALPKVLSKETMGFYHVRDLSQLKKGYMGILEPDETCGFVSPIDKTSLMIVPGLAFDRNLGRLGYGGGYYDRYFEKYADKLIRCGVAYQCQMIDRVPCMPYDFLMNVIVTEDEWLERMDVK